MRPLQKTCMIACAALVLVATTTAIGFAQLREQSGLLQRIWPFGRQQPPVPLAPESDQADKPADEGQRPLVAPFVARKVDINTCTLSQLQSLPGVNASLGAHIFAGRPYRDFGDLERDGIPLNVVQGLRGKVSFGR